MALLHLLVAALLSFPQASVGDASQAYHRILTSDREVQIAVKAAIADRQKVEKAIRLKAIVSAERAAVSGSNLRLCLSMDRSGTTEFARVVVSREAKKRWSLDLWTWGSCGR
jgi:hypothetical protein